jgi:hypothetical protein
MRERQLSGRGLMPKNSVVALYVGKGRTTKVRPTMLIAPIILRMEFIFEKPK